MPVTLYGIDASPVVRGTLLTIGALGIDFEIKVVNTLLGEQYSPEFLKLNPLHTVPTIKDGDFVIWDSHAINCYLADKYGKDDSLYPKDLHKRAVVNQRLFFNCGVLFPKLMAVLVSVMRDGETTVRKDLADALTEAYSSLETLLERSTYVAGDQVTVADFSIVATVSSTNVVVPIALNRFPKINEWLAKMQALPYYAEGNQVGLDKYAIAVKSKMS